MSRLALIVLATLALAAPAAAQAADAPASASAAETAALAAAQTAPQTAPETAPETALETAPETAPETADAPPPTDYLADRFFAPQVMARARAQLRREHGGAGGSMVMASLAEYRPLGGSDGYRWDGQAWFGGDIHRLVLKSQGEGVLGQGVETAELQALYSRAVGVYADVQIGVRQDFAPRGRTYAAAGFEMLLPYWVDVTGAAFLSDKGELLGRVEGSYDLRLTNRLILQPRAELNVAAQDTPQTRTGSGLSTAELGLRLRYELRRRLAPYVGVSWDRRFGKTADYYARALGEAAQSTTLVVGVRAFF